LSEPDGTGILEGCLGETVTLNPEQYRTTAARLMWRALRCKGKNNRASVFLVSGINSYLVFFPDHVQGAAFLFVGDEHNHIYICIHIREYLFCNKCSNQMQSGVGMEQSSPRARKQQTTS
jgi:hypothetical protein